jgi:hypothetical protein
MISTTLFRMAIYNFAASVKTEVVDIPSSHTMQTGEKKKRRSKRRRRHLYQLT